MRLFARLFVALCLPFAAHAATEVPAPLEPWRAWVMHEQEFRACPLISGHAGAQAGLTGARIQRRHAGIQRRPAGAREHLVRRGECGRLDRQRHAAGRP